jgi:hypothetical protein
VTRGDQRNSALRRPRIPAVLALTALTLLAAAGSGGCFTLLGKGISEARGGRGEQQPIRALPPGKWLDRYAGVELDPVLPADTAGPIPPTLPGTVRDALVRELVSERLFAGGPGPRVILRVRLTAHWPDSGLAQVIDAYSLMLGVVELIEPGQSQPFASYHVKGLSTAIARKDDSHLADGFASEVVSILKEHKSKYRRA